MNRAEAIACVERVREQIARIEMFRAFRAHSTAATAVLAIAGGVVQERWELSGDLPFVILWTTIALIGVLIVAIEMALRYRAADSTLARDATIAAVRQFQPCLIAGGLVTFGILLAAPQAIHLLPALWAVCFSLGIFGVRPGLPEAAKFIAAWYLLAGVVLIALGGRSSTFCWWWMPLTFGIGQTLSAIVLAISQRNEGCIER
jgi:hypothetical protein